MIDLDAEVSAEKTMVALVFEIDGDGIHTGMALIDQDTTVLLQIVVLGSEIRCLGAVVFVGIQHHAVAGIQGHAVAETPTGMARALFYIVSASPSFLHPFNQSTIPIIPFIRL